MSEIRGFHRLQFNCNHIDWCSGASLGVTRVAEPRGKHQASAVLAVERKVGQIMGGRGNWPTTAVDVQHVLANSDIRIFKIHFCSGGLGLKSHSVICQKGLGKRAKRAKRASEMLWQGPQHRIKIPSLCDIGLL